MSEVPWSSILTVVGVIVGFSLSQVADFFKSRKNRHNIKKALINELSVTKNNLDEAIKHDYKLSYDCLPFITGVFDNSKVSLASTLNLRQLETVQQAYARIKELGSPREESLILSRGYSEIGDGKGVLYKHELKKDADLVGQAINELTKED